MRGRRFRFLSLKWHMVKNSEKSLAREKNFTLTWPVKLYQQEKKEVNFIITGRHHLIRPSLILLWGRSCLNLTEVPWRDRRVGPSSFWDWHRVSRSPSWTCRPWSGKLLIQHGGWCNLWKKGTFAWVVEPFLSEKRSN